MVADKNRVKAKEETKSGGRTTRTATMTFRVNESSMRKLREEAENREISLNTLVNQIFKRYVEWGSYEPKVGMIPIAKPVLIQLFESISEEKIIEIATKVGKGAVKDIALFMKHSIDIDSFLDWFETRMKTASVEISPLFPRSLYLIYPMINISITL